MDNRVFQLAEKIKQDMLDLYKDYKDNHITKEFISACIVNSQVILDNMVEIWEVNLDEYYNKIDSIKL